MASKLSALIAATTEKTALVNADKLPLLDSAATEYFKHITWSALKTALADLFATLAGKSGGQTLIGGTGITDKLVLQGTSGNGTSTATALEVKVGNNGATSALKILNDGACRFLGAVSQTSAGVNRLDIGVQDNTPRIAYENNIAASIWLMDVHTNGVFRIYNPGFERLNISTAYVEMKTHDLSIRAGTSPAASIHTIKTTEQLRLGYDASNYASFTVASDGTLKLTSSNNKIALGASRTPASATAAGVAGEVCWDASYIYVCTATNTWKRAAIATW